MCVERCIVFSNVPSCHTKSRVRQGCINRVECVNVCCPLKSQCKFFEEEFFMVVPMDNKIDESSYG